MYVPSHNVIDMLLETDGSRLINCQHRHFAGVGVTVLVGVSVGVGVGVVSHVKYNISSQPFESVTITTTSLANGATLGLKNVPNSGNSNSNVGGTETTPVAATAQYVLVLSHIVISYGDFPVRLVIKTELI